MKATNRICAFVHCREQIPHWDRLNKRFCSNACRQADYRQRTRLFTQLGCRRKK